MAPEAPVTRSWAGILNDAALPIDTAFVDALLDNLWRGITDPRPQ